MAEEWDDEKEGRKPWESPPKKKKPKKKKGQSLDDLDTTEQDTNYSDAFEIAQDRKKRQKKLAPYAKTGPGA
jgi:hypothetical protein